ncbi:MAG: histidine kinase [Actinomycetota bacterium]|nr:histidine kinase [Actinomycetota bacterium]
MPYVAIERARDGSQLAVFGQPSATTDRWPLSHEGQVEGLLVASPRRGEENFDDRDRELLEDVARHAGLAIHAEGLTADLLLSRQRLVTAREEERRRLRRELHDHLGPVLTGVGLNLDAARARFAGVNSVVDSDHAAADELLAEAKRASAQAIADLRRVVYGLRPPALDDLGLTGAVRAQAERLCAGAGLSLSVEAGELPELAAAVEVAAYRVVVEAVTNAVRHGHGERCWVRMDMGEPGRLRVQVENDGVSANGSVPGVGLTGMRERAEELGGTMSVGPRDGGGVRVVVEFPL